MQPVIFNLQKFSLHDGPGIRTVVFFKGCPLHCPWCSNPESQSFIPQVSVNHQTCIRCQACVRSCPNHAIRLIDNRIVIDHQLCDQNGVCITNCPTDSLKMEGYQPTYDQLIEKIMQDWDFYEESGGGVTLSGGEVLAQPIATLELIKQLKAHQLHVAIETTGFAQPTTFTTIAKELDLVLMDIKHYDNNIHQAVCGVPLDTILENAKAVQQLTQVIYRIPVVPGFNDQLSDVKGFVQLFNQLGINQVQLLPFHQLGSSKYDSLNMPYQYNHAKPLYEEDLTAYINAFEQSGIHCKI
jgi:pyruvate formate lyase activating enzyme